jgi:hypothetical protein
MSFSSTLSEEKDTMSLLKSFHSSDNPAHDSPQSSRAELWFYEGYVTDHIYLDRSVLRQAYGTQSSYSLISLAFEKRQREAMARNYHDFEAEDHETKACWF